MTIFMAFPDEKNPPDSGKFFRLTFINVLSNITVPLAGMADTLMLGHLPDIRFLAGTALASVIFDFVFWGLAFLRMATTGITARADARDSGGTEIAAALARPLLIAVAAGFLILAAGRPLFEAGIFLLGGDPGVKSAASDYFFARLPAAPAVLCHFALNGWFLGRGKSHVVLGLTVFTNLLNIALNFLFIRHWGLAAAGAGAATMLSQVVSLLPALFLAFRILKLNRWRKIFQDGKEWLSLFRLNGNIMLRTLLLLCCFSFFTSVSSSLGRDFLAANSILRNLMVFAALFLDGAAMALETAAGHLSAPENRKQLRSLLVIALKMAGGVALFFMMAAFLPIITGESSLLRLFTGNPRVNELLRDFLPFTGVAVFFGSFAFMYDGFFLGLSDGRILRNTMFAASVAVFLPLSAAALQTENNPLLWLAMDFFMLARALLLSAAVRRFFSGIDARRAV